MQHFETLAPFNLADTPMAYNQGRPRVSHQMRETNVELSVVIAVYRAESCLELVHERLITALSALGKTYEIIFVEDRSPDDSWSAVKRLIQRDPNVRGARLSRNFGQHAAITAGLSLVRGQWAILMDCDGQDPPEQIERLYSKALEGYEVVLARRIKRRHSLLRQFLSNAYFKLLNKFAETSVDGSTGTFSIISRKVVDAFISFPEINRHYMLLLHWMGFRRTYIDYEHGVRDAGESSYTFGKLIKHAVQGMFFQTTALLEQIILLGFVVSFCGFALAAWIIASYYLHSSMPGWTSLAVLMLVLGGFHLMAIGIVGMYVGQIFSQTKGRPLFIFDELLPLPAQRDVDMLSAGSHLSAPVPVIQSYVLQSFDPETSTLSRGAESATTV